MSGKPSTDKSAHAETAGASAGTSYASAGVDIEAGDRAVELFKPLAKRATRPEVRGGLGGFAGLFALRGGYREPVLAASTDGVGTKLAIAQAMDKHDTVGLDLVAMVVDDLVVCGAEPLFLQDYIAVGRVVPERVQAIVAGIAEGCVLAGCALLGGETAEHPGLMEPDHYDLSATGVGVVEADAVLGRQLVADRDDVRPIRGHARRAQAGLLAQRADHRLPVRGEQLVEFDIASRAAGSPCPRCGAIPRAWAARRASTEARRGPSVPETPSERRTLARMSSRALMSVFPVWLVAPSIAPETFVPAAQADRADRSSRQPAAAM